jgi:puromycin-sensitive aminopeptidase
MPATQTNPYRLSDDVLPRAYRLILEPDLEAAIFAGSVEIDVEVAVATTEIVMNAVDLEISSATLSLAGGTAVSCTVSLDPETERVTLNPGIEIPVGAATVQMTFSGVLNDLLVGFYRSTFVDPEGVTRTIATTQMEATDARRAFPCFDEPAKKATFEISLVIDAELSAYSNSPIVSTAELDGERALVRFSPTMVMSTYLVAFVVGPFEATDPIDVDGVPVRVIYPPGKAELAPFAIEIAAFSLRYFSDYFGIPYPGDKVDLVAIPDFAFGAMENLGCVTFRETALLVDPATASRNEVERVVDVVAHELAHMWFGDLVTMGWWEGIWLNEAFATFMEIKCADAFRPQWRRWDSFGISREVAMVVDGMHSTRPIEFEVVSPNDARGMFDVLTYEKGGGVLRMLEQYLGEDTFRDGIRRYLNAHAYANTVTADLWAALSEASKLPVGEIMDTWILQGGHPLVRFAEGKVSQQPFAYGPARAESAIGSSWQVPLLTRPLAGGEASKQILGTEAVALAAGSLVNAGGWGTYRTSYGAAETAEVAAAIRTLAPLERFSLIADGWAAVQAGQGGLADYLSLVDGLGTEVEPAVWSTVSASLGALSRIISEDERPALAALGRQLGAPLFDELGWDAVDGEDENAPTLRAIVLAVAGGVGEDEAVRTEALSRFEADTMSGDIAATVLGIVGAIDRAGDVDTMLGRLRATSNPQLQDRYYAGLASFKSPEVALRVFELCRSEFRTQDAPYIVRQLLANRTAGAAVFDALCEHWDEVLERFPENALSRMLSGVSMMYTSTELAQRATAFLNAHPLATGQRSVEQDLERLSVGVALGERLRPGLGELLEAATTR